MRCSLTTFCTLLLATLAATLPAAADDGEDLASLMDETALAVARLDITAEGPATTFASLAFPGQTTPSRLALWRDVFRKLLAAAGVRHVDLVIQVPSQLPTSYQALAMEALCVIPCDKAETAELMAKLPGLALPDKSWRVATRGRYCLLGPAALVTSALAGNHPAPPDWSRRWRPREMRRWRWSSRPRPISVASCRRCCPSCPPSRVATCCARGRASPSGRPWLTIRIARCGWSFEPLRRKARSRWPARSTRS